MVDYTKAADAVITIEGKQYALFKKGTLSKYPYMVDLSTGGIPYREQRPLLKEFLLQNGVDIEPWETKGPHWCVRQAIKVAQGTTIPTPVVFQESVSTPQKPVPKVRREYLSLTAENIEQIHQQVLKDTSYGTDTELIHTILSRFPENTDRELVTMKMAVIDLTNSTHIGMHRGKVSLHELVQVVLDISDFDMRLAQGDPELVSQLARTNGKVNFFSFASKYCTYHSVAAYKRDDYSIFDNVVENSLPHYAPQITKAVISGWRTTYNYAAFNRCIGELLDRNHIQIPFRRRKFDHFLWYSNRK